MLRELSWSAIWRAAITTCTFAVPLGLLQQYLLDSGDLHPTDATNLVIYLAIFFCGALGGYAAAGLAPTSHLQNGAAAAALATVMIQAVGAVRRLIVGVPISNPIAWIFMALLMATFGMFGAYIHRTTHSQSSDSDRSGANQP